LHIIPFPDQQTNGNNQQCGQSFHHMAKGFFHRNSFQNQISGRLGDFGLIDNVFLWTHRGEAEATPKRKWSFALAKAPLDCGRVPV